MRRFAIRVVALVTATVAGGCGPRPEELRNQLRREIQDLEAQVAQLQREKAASDASLRAVREAAPGAPLPGPDELSRLFTVHGVTLGRLTRLVEPSPGSTQPWSLRVHVTPTDDDGEPIKATGAIEVRASAAGGGDTPVGAWTFTSDEARKSWRGQALLYEYVVNCELPEAWKPVELQVDVRFTDTLTGRSFQARQRVEPRSR